MQKKSEARAVNIRDGIWSIAVVAISSLLSFFLILSRKMFRIWFCVFFQFLIKNFEIEMKTRSSRKAVAQGDTVVSTAVAKRDWFLKSSDLVTLPHAGGGAAWGVGRFPTYYSVKDLDRLALRVHGAAGLGKKKAARARRLEKKEEKSQIAPAHEKTRRRSRSAARASPTVVIEEVQVDDDADFSLKPLKKQKVETVKRKVEVLSLGKSLNEQKQRNLQADGEWGVIDCGDC